MSVKSGSITFNIYTDRDNSLALSVFGSATPL